MVQHNFGYETIGSYWGTIEDIIKGGVFTCSEVGTADSITVALCFNPAGQDWTGKLKCAIYLHSDLSRIGVTEERTITLTLAKAWYTFNFTAPKPNIIAADYVLVVWAEAKTGIPYVAQSSGTGDNQHYQSLTYNGFPNPLGPTHATQVVSIYCTYTVAGGGVTVKKGSGLAATMTEMLNSKMLFSACNRFPKLTTRRF